MYFLTFYLQIVDQLTYSDSLHFTDQTDDFSFLMLRVRTSAKFWRPGLTIRLNSFYI